MSRGSLPLLAAPLAVLVACAAPAHDTGTSTRGGVEAEAEDASGSDREEEDPGLADEEEEDYAALESYTFPEELACGASYEAVVTLKNTGTSTWTRAAGFKLGAVGDEDPLLDSGDVRVWLDDEDAIAPGDSHTFVVPLLAPDEETEAWTDWQMVHEHVGWFGDSFGLSVAVTCEDAGDTGDDLDYPLPLPDMGWVVDEVASEHPDWLANSCQDDGGTWDFMDEVVDRLRTYDDRWGYNWKRGVVGDPSEDAIDYHYGPGEHEGATEVYILDVITGHCGNDPQPGWLDVTQDTADAGTIGMWTGRGRF